MNDNSLWLWLAAGLLPYRIERQYRADGPRVIVRALFWSLTVRRRRGRYTWTLHVLVVERLRDAIWAAVMRLKGGGE